MAHSVYAAYYYYVVVVPVSRCGCSVMVVILPSLRGGIEDIGSEANAMASAGRKREHL